MSDFEFDFLTRRPAAPLRRLVESVWYARGTVPYTRESISPTGSCVAVFVLGDAIIETASGPSIRTETGFLLGCHDRPVINEPTGETFAVGIVTTAVGCTGVFGVQPATVSGRVVDLLSTWGPAKRLRNDMLTAPTAAAMLDIIEHHLTEHATYDVRGLERCEQAVAMLEHSPTRSIASIAAQLGVSHGHLDREFKRIVGLTPRRLARVLRLNRLIAGLDVRDTVAWADLATDLGWADQPHLIRDFKRHTGVTPTQYIAAQRANFSSKQLEGGAAFVPETV